MKTPYKNQVDRNYDGNRHADPHSAKAQLREQAHELPGAGSVGMRGKGRQHVGHC